MLPSSRILLPVLLVVTSIAVAGGFFVGDSLAIFTDQETNAANTIGTGNIALDDAPDSAFLTVANMIPGDSTIQPLTITNAGAGELRYSMTTAADNVDTKNLRDQLQLTLRVKTANPCASEDGAIISGPGILSAAAFGSAAQGANPATARSPSPRVRCSASRWSCRWRAMTRTRTRLPRRHSRSMPNRLPTTLSRRRAVAAVRTPPRIA